jgi:hypothetical protein
MLKALRHYIAWIQYSIGLRVPPFSVFIDKAVQLGILVILSTLVPPFVEEDAFDIGVKTRTNQRSESVECERVEKELASLN